MTLAYYTGWRINSEILTLEWQQIDRDAGVIRLEPGTTKNREGRVFLFAELAEVVAAMRSFGAPRGDCARGRMTPLVFCRRKGQAVKTFWKRWTTAARPRASRRIPHDFRRTAVRNLNRAACPKRGDEGDRPQDPDVFDRYDITSEEDLAEASRKLRALTMGTIAGTNATDDADALRDRIAKSVKGKGLVGGEGQNRTVDTTIFSRMLYQLSYLAMRWVAQLATW